MRFAKRRREINVGHYVRGASSFAAVYLGGCSRSCLEPGMKNIFLLKSARALSPLRCAVRQSGDSLALVFFLATVVAISGCVAGSDLPATDVANAKLATPQRCSTSKNLLTDSRFTMEGEYERAWRMAQHAGERSFSMESTDGVLEIRRIATQPWVLLRQTVNDARLSGATIRYSAELKGDLPSEPTLHGFDHIGGLYLKVGRDPARLAEHEPNADQWDWQTFYYEQQVPEGVTSLRAGFIHQTNGALWARNPSLVMLDCD